MPRRAREREIPRIRARLLRIGFPRLRMLLLIVVTGAAGLLASFLMLHGGVPSMPLRYALALLVAYGTFLLLVRWFVQHGDLSNLDLPANPSGGGGHPAAEPIAEGSSDTDTSWLDGVVGADGGALALLLAVAVVVIAFALLWVLISAPTLFAELAIDGALSAGLYRRLRRIETRHWLETAVRHTFWPFVATAIVLVGFALAAQHYRPHAHSIGELFTHADTGATHP